MKTLYAHCRLILVFVSVLFMLFSHKALGGEFVIMNQTFTYTVNANAFACHVSPPFDNSIPANWLSPENYWTGSIHAYYEVISVPTSEPFGFQMGIFQYMPSQAQWDGVNFYETCSYAVPELRGVGDVLEYNYGSPSSWWQHWNGAVDFSRVYDFESVGPVIYSLVPGASGALSTTAGGGDDAAWAIRYNWFPCTIRVIIVAVSAGSQFSGWANYVNGGPCTPVAQATPSYAIDYANETTTSVVPSTDEYSGNADMSGAVSGTGQKLALTPGQTVYFRTKQLDECHLASNIQTLVVPQRPSAPSFSVDYIYETTVEAVSSNVEYSTSPGMTSTSTGTGATVALTPGQDMYFRIKATGSAFASLNFVLDVPERPAAPAGYTIDFLNERTVENVGSNIAYSTSPVYLNPVSGSDITVSVTPGQDLYFWVKGSASVFKSATYRLIVPARPAAPSIAINFITEVTSVISSTQEWSTSAVMALPVAGTNSGVPVTPGIDLYIRNLATVNAFKSSIQTLDVPDRPAAPAYQINYTTERTVQVVPSSDEYSLNPDMSAASSGSGVALTLTPGTDVYFRTKASLGSFISGIQHLTVGLRPASPEFQINYVNETTAENVSNTIEYSTAANMASAMTGTGIPVTLTPGQDMYFRVKASATAFASLNFVLDVPERPAAPAGYTVDFINETTVENVSTALAYSTSPAYLNPLSGTGNKVPVTPGQDLYFWIKGSIGVFNSSTFRLAVPNRPAAPAIAINFTTEVTSAISSTQEWSTNPSMVSAFPGTNTGIPVTPGMDLYIRNMATAGTFRSSVQTLDVPDRPSVPAYQINYATERTSQLIPAADEYSYYSDMSFATSGTGVALSLIPGTDVYFRTKASINSFISGIQHLTVGLRPASPEFHINYVNETTSENINNTIEYSPAADMASALTGTGVPVTLTPGQIMYFRVKATASSFASLNHLLNVPARPAAPPGYTIDYINERTIEEVNTDITFSTSPTYSNPVSGTGSRVTVTPGQDLYFWIKGSTGVFNSSTFRLIVPNRPVAPAVTIDFTREVTSTISSAEEWSTSPTLATAITGTNTGIPVTPGTDLYIRNLATANAFKSLTQNLNVPDRPATPSYQINYVTEKTSKAVPITDEYSRYPDMSSASSGTGIALSLTPGTDLFFRTKASASSFISEIQYLSVGFRPAPPAFQINFENITTLENVNNTIEYSSSSDMASATTGKGVPVSLSPGHDMYFRIKATGSAFASLNFPLLVPAAPILVYTGNDTTTSGTITVQAVLEETMTGFDLTDLSVINGTAQNIRENNTFDVIAGERGLVTVNILSNAFGGASFPSNAVTVFYNKNATGISLSEESQFIVYPNPSHDGIIHIKAENGLPFTVEVYSNEGALVKIWDMNGGKDQIINLQALAKGIYFLKINARGKTFIKKAVLE